MTTWTQSEFRSYWMSNVTKWLFYHWIMFNGVWITREPWQSSRTPGWRISISWQTASKKPMQWTNRQGILSWCADSWALQVADQPDWPTADPQLPKIPDDLFPRPSVGRYDPPTNPAIACIADRVSKRWPRPWAACVKAWAVASPLVPVVVAEYGI